jgi:hypothetical protein
MHEIGWGIHKSEGHHGILIESIPGTKRCLVDIWLSNPRLVIFLSQIDLGENTGSLHLIEHILDSGQKVLVLIGDLIPRTVIHTHPLGPIFLLYESTHIL